MENELKIEQAKLKAQEIAGQNVSNLNSNMPYIFSNNEENSGKRKFALPKLEFRKFNGDIIEWLPFWGQFSNVHNDEEIALEDKFQYLVQCTVAGSRARQVIESYPPTAENYNKAVDALKTRFGDENLLIEVYVRELLKLIMSAQSQKRPCLSFLYDKLETYMRALETLGVTTDKCASLLYPMVESCFPYDFLKTWHRSISSQAKREAKDRLDDLLNFLKAEVEGEARIGLAMAGFGLNREYETTSRSRKKSEGNFKGSPTASALLNTDDKKLVCVFCERAHKSYECRTIANMTYEQKKAILVKKNACFKCLVPLHHSRACPMLRIRCKSCGAKTHNSVMCYKKKETDREIEDVSKEQSTNRPLGTGSVLSNHTDETDVMLQTLRVRVRNNGKEAVIRAMYDTGSQRSYATTELLEKLDIEPTREIRMIHSLFGGKCTEEESRQDYILNLSDVKNSLIVESEY